MGELLTYLQDLDPTYTTPVIYADYNQTGGGDSLWLSAVVDIIDPANPGTPVASWFLDSINNINTFNPDFPTYNFGEISFLPSQAECDAAGQWNPLTGVGCAGVTADGTSTYTASHNLGSGQADFMAYAPTMDLTAYNRDFLWTATLNLGCLPGVIGPYPPGPNNDDTPPWDRKVNDVGCNTNGAEEFGIAGGVGPDTQLIPEPSTLALLGLGLVGFGFSRYRRN